MNNLGKFIAHVNAANRLKPGFHTLATCVGLAGVVIGIVPFGIYVDLAPRSSFLWKIPLLTLLVGIPVSLYLGCVVAAALAGSFLAAIGKISWSEAIRYALLSRYPTNWFESDSGTPLKDHDKPVVFRIESPGTKIAGAIGAIIPAGISIGAFLEGSYWPSLMCAVIALWGSYLFLSAGAYEFSDSGVAHRNWFGRFRMRWKDVREVENGSAGSIVLHGRNQRFVIMQPSAWYGSQTADVLDLLRTKLDAPGIRAYSSRFGDFKIHKNVAQ